MTTLKPLRVLVVDDTILYRKIVSDTLAEIPGVEVVGTANNGKIAMARIASLQPDLLTLDVEMPEMNGLDVLNQIKDQGLSVGAIMVSAVTLKGSEITIKALELGAFDFIRKPDSGSMEENRKAAADALVPMVKAYVRRNEITSILKGRTAPAGPLSAGGKVQESSSMDFASPRSSGGLRNRPEVVAIGISTGGPNALARMLPLVPGDLGVPILIVQHMPPLFTQSLATSLNNKCSIQVKEASDGEPLAPNVAYIAPGGKQMKVAQGADGKQVIVKITDDPPENSCKPSADYLFRSLAYLYKGKATGVIMTGMGSDGTLGLKLMKRYGAVVIAQDEATCVVYGMPKASIDAGIVDIVSPLDNIAAHICRTVRS